MHTLGELPPVGGGWKQHQYHWGSTARAQAPWLPPCRRAAVGLGEWKMQGKRRQHTIRMTFNAGAARKQDISQSSRKREVCSLTAAAEDSPPQEPSGRAMIPSVPCRVQG